MRTSRRSRRQPGAILRTIIVAVAVVLGASAASIRLLQADIAPTGQTGGRLHVPATLSGDSGSIAPSPKPRKGPVQTFEVFASRDPFEPLVEAPGSSAGDDARAAATGTTETEAATGQAADDEADAASADAAAASAPTDGTTRREREDSHATHAQRSARLPIRLVTIRERREAVIRIGRRLHRSGAGERFAPNFKLLTLGRECASILYGDEQFALCRGQEILK